MNNLEGIYLNSNQLTNKLFRDAKETCFQDSFNEAMQSLYEKQHLQESSNVITGGISDELVLDFAIAYASYILADGADDIANFNYYNFYNILCPNDNPKYIVQLHSAKIEDADIVVPEVYKKLHPINKNSYKGDFEIDDSEIDDSEEYTTQEKIDDNIENPVENDGYPRMSFLRYMRI